MSSERDLSNLSGIEYCISKELLVKLRDEAVASALDAEVRKDKWRRACLILARKTLTSKFGDWEDREGVLQFTGLDQPVKLIKLVESGYFDNEPQVVYVEKLKSGRFSKSSTRTGFTYVMNFFKPKIEEGKSK